MLKRLGVDLQTHVDTIHHAAVEILRDSPEPQTIAAGKRAIELVIEHASHSAHAQSVLDVARVTEEAFQIVGSQHLSDRIRAGHYVAAIVADLSRSIDALDSGEDPGPFVNHARSLAGSIPRPDEHNLVEIDLNDRNQLLRLMELTAASDSGTAPSVQDPELDEAVIHQELNTLGSYAEHLLEYGEDPVTIEGLVHSLLALQDLAAQQQIDHIGRVVACALRVVESHRSAGESLPLDAVEFIIACRRILPIILDSMDSPARVNHAVDALVDQSAFVLLELRRGTSSLSNLWPEPNATEYRELSNGSTSPAYPEADLTGDNVSLSELTEWTVEEYRPSSGSLTGPGPGTQALTHDESEIRIPVEHIERLIDLAGELAVRSGGYNQRSRRVLSVSQDMNSIADRLRYLVRAWQDGKYQTEQVEQLLTEVSADLGLAAGDLEHARNDYLSASERQADVRERLEETIAALRSMPLKLITDPLERSFRELAASFGKQAILRVEGASNVVDAVHAEQITEMFRHLIVNSLEHGIEAPDVRQEEGKSPAGLVRIRARRDGSQTVIQVIDDGAGMNESMILDRAEASGYPIPRRDMTRDRVLQYIFLPGYTTRDVKPGVETGMGLDFVSDVISRMGGAITVQSEPGQGTAFTIRLPVALMTLPATIVAISSERYALPAAAISRVDPGEISEIEEVSDGYRARIGDSHLVAADLGALLGVRSHHHVQSDSGQFIKVGCDAEQWLLRVDRILDEESITLQPAGREFIHLNGVVGMSRLHSGEDALVLDVIQLLDASSTRSRRFSRQTASLSRVPFALVSDDSISVRRQIAGHLEQTGWRVVEARDAFEARELLENVTPELIVVDLDLPAHGGFQIVQSARNLSTNPVIIGLTGREASDVRERIQSFRIDECLSKPLDLDKLDLCMERINRTLNADQ
jgi:chemotaxis protein histidine kinase CheA/CheY-like chemotaxis protein